MSKTIRFHQLIWKHYKPCCIYRFYLPLDRLLLRNELPRARLLWIDVGRWSHHWNFEWIYSFKVVSGPLLWASIWVPSSSIHPRTMYSLLSTSSISALQKTECKAGHVYLWLDNDLFLWVLLTEQLFDLRYSWQRNCWWMVRSLEDCDCFTEVARGSPFESERHWSSFLNYERSAF